MPSSFFSLSSCIVGMRKVTYFYAYLEKLPKEGEMCIQESRKDKPWLYLSIANAIIFCICIAPLHSTAFPLKCRAVWMPAKLCQLILDEAVVLVLKTRHIPYQSLLNLPACVVFHT